ncbi:Hypothetical predicted protein [Pelobates cultripes]|uniref:Uncharacterized protein n=1 Tax=Pelobates cultripes TaxID=61616 RepID=A0AAD1SS90_PELCU|nr:Hypothetical predicted protein [Pelobates cultripes]
MTAVKLIITRGCITQVGDAPLNLMTPPRDLSEPGPRRSKCGLLELKRRGDGRSLWCRSQKAISPQHPPHPPPQGEQTCWKNKKDGGGAKRGTNPHSLSKMATQPMPEMWSTSLKTHRSSMETFD